MNLKLLFVEPNITNLKSLKEAVKGFPIRIVFQQGLEKPYILDTGLKVELSYED